MLERPPSREAGRLACAPPAGGAVHGAVARQALGSCQRRRPWRRERQSRQGPSVVREGIAGLTDSLGEAVRRGEDPLLCDEAAPAEVASVSLDADLPRPLTLQGILPAYHPVQHPSVPAD